MLKKRMIELRARAQRLKPTVHVGKEGVTPWVADEILRQLKKKKLVKVRLLPPQAQDRKAAARALAESTFSVLIEVRGNTVVLAQE